MSRTYRQIPSHTYHKHPSQTRQYGQLSSICFDSELNGFDISKRNRILRQASHRPNLYDDVALAALYELDFNKIDLKAC